MGSQRVRHDWVTNAFTFTNTWRNRKCLLLSAISQYGKSEDCMIQLYGTLGKSKLWRQHKISDWQGQGLAVGWTGRTETTFRIVQFRSVQFSRSVVFNSLWPHESQHARPPCPSPTPGVHPNSYTYSLWYYNGGYIPLYICTNLQNVQV